MGRFHHKEPYQLSCAQFAKCRNLTPNTSGNGGKRNLHQTLAVMVEKVERPVGSQQDEKLEKCSLSSKNKSFFDRLRKSNAHIIYEKSQHFIRSKSTRKTKKKSRRSNVLCPSLQFLWNFYPLFWGQNRSAFFSPDNIFPLFYMCIIALSPHYLLEQGKKY